MGVKFLPSLFCDVDKGLFGAFFRAHAVDVDPICLKASGPEQRLWLRIRLSNCSVSRTFSNDVEARGPWIIKEQDQ
jgi:hypothetical protein